MPRKYGEMFVEALLFMSAITSILIMLLIFYFLIHESLPAFSQSRPLLPDYSAMKWHPAGDIYGFLPLYSPASLTITLLALFINIIIGFPLAIYLAELAGPKSKAFLKPAIELLAGVPSIVYGFLGVIILVSYLQDSFVCSRAGRFWLGPSFSASCSFPTSPPSARMLCAPCPAN